MRKKRRRRKKKRSVVVRRLSSFIQTYDPEYLHSVGTVFLAVIVAIAWWNEGWNEAVLYFKVLFFIGLGVSLGLNICALIYFAVRGISTRKDLSLSHAAVKLSVIGIALIATEDGIGIGTKAALGGIGFAAFIFLFTIVLSSVLSWFRR